MNYSYTRTTDLFGNFTGRITPRTGVTLADYTPGAGFSGTLPDGTAYNVPTFIPNPAVVAAGGNGFATTNIPGYFTDYSGVELSVVKRLSNRWMGRVSVSLNNAREHFDSPEGIYDTNGNPTTTLSEPLKAFNIFNANTVMVRNNNVLYQQRATLGSVSASRSRRRESPTR